MSSGFPTVSPAYDARGCDEGNHRVGRGRRSSLVKKKKRDNKKISVPLPKILDSFYTNFLIVSKFIFSGRKHEEGQRFNGRLLEFFDVKRFENAAGTHAPKSHLKRAENAPKTR